MERCVGLPAARHSHKRCCICSDAERAISKWAGSDRRANLQAGGHLADAARRKGLCGWHGRRRQLRCCLGQRRLATGSQLHQLGDHF